MFEYVLCFVRSFIKLTESSDPEELIFVSFYQKDYLIKNEHGFS